MNQFQTKFFLTKKKEKIRYRLVKRSKKLTIIFLHGLMSDINGTKVIAVNKVCNEYNISFLAFEYSGHGCSSGDFHNYGIKDWIDQSKEIIEKIIKTKNIIIVGSSMGSWIGSCLLKKIKKKIIGFVGIASAPDFTKEIMWKNFTNKTRSLIKSGKIYKMPSKYAEPYPISLKLIKGGDQSLILNKKIKCDFPILLFHGLKDKVVDETFSIRLAKTLVSRDVKIFFQKNGDHSLSSKKDLQLISSQLVRLFKNTI